MHRHTNQIGIEFIKNFEGFSAKPYICSGGHRTIGYGHKIRANESFNEIDISAAKNLLKQDLLIAESAVIKLINRPLTDNQFAALVSFTYNLGSAALQRSTLRQKVNYGLHKEIEHEFLRWIYANGKKLKGLIRRRKSESMLFFS